MLLFIILSIFPHSLTSTDMGAGGGDPNSEKGTVPAIKLLI